MCQPEQLSDGLGREKSTKVTSLAAKIPHGD